MIYSFKLCTEHNSRVLHVYALCSARISATERINVYTVLALFYFVYRTVLNVNSELYLYYT